MMPRLPLSDPQRSDSGPSRPPLLVAWNSTAYLAHTNWQFGEVERARALIDEAVVRATESGHAPTAAQVHQFN